MEECTAALASLTYAIKAQRALAAAGIASDIIKLDSSRTKRGCSYGVLFDCRLSDKVRKSLKAAEVGVRRYLKGGGETI